MRALPINIGAIHFVGIGGIGMSGIAEVLHTLGYQVQGSDIADSYVIDGLRQRGIKAGGDMCFLIPRWDQDGNQRILGRGPLCLCHTAEIIYRKANRKQRQGKRNPGQEIDHGAVSARGS